MFCPLGGLAQGHGILGISQPVGGGRLIRFFFMHSLICFLVHSTNIFKSRYGTGPLLGVGTSQNSVLFSSLGSLVPDHPPVLGCLLHSAFPSLLC